jgi:hypothetical protein
LAVPPTTDEAFLREVDEELRRDTLQSFWQKWGRWLIAALIGGLALFGGWLYWQERQASLAGTEGEELTRSLESLAGGSVDAAKKGITPLKQSEIDAHRALASLTDAAILIQKGDNKGAAAAFDAIAKDTSLSQPWRDLALVRQSAAEFDTAKPETIIARLKPLAVKGNPWFGSAGELVAMAHLKMGKSDLAGALFAEIGKDEAVPETLRSRAIQMAGTLGVDAVPLPSKADEK